MKLPGCFLPLPVAALFFSDPDLLRGDPACLAGSYGSPFIGGRAGKGRATPMLWRINLCRIMGFGMTALPFRIPNINTSRQSMECPRERKNQRSPAYLIKCNDAVSTFVPEKFAQRQMAPSAIFPPHNHRFGNILKQTICQNH